MLTLLAIFVLSYLVGSIPTAFILVKRKADLDIRQEGSGSVGGFNAYIVTRLKSVGILVGVLDALKGFVAVYVTGQVFPGDYSSQAIALFGAITGHNYPVWLRFKGGRGLATAAGGLFLLGFSYTVVWCFLWLVGRLFRRDILTSNIIAIFFTPVVLSFLPWRWVRELVLIDIGGPGFLFFSCIVSLQLLLSHFDALLALWKHSRAESL